jgi:flagellin-like hook-associated protein FlgL
MIQDRLNDTFKKINNGGLEKSNENLFYKLRNENIQQIKSTELKGIQAAETKYQHYDNIFGEMTTTLDTFREKIIGKIHAGRNTVDTQTINNDMVSLKDTFQSLVDTKINGEKMFDHASELLIGDNMRVPRTFDDSHIEINNQKIVDLLQNFINDPDPDLDDFDKISNFINMRHTEMGARWDGIQRTKSLYENIQMTENEFMSKRYKLEEAIHELNDLSLSYEALNKTIAKISGLSLVNYV